MSDRTWHRSGFTFIPGQEVENVTTLEPAIYRAGYMGPQWILTRVSEKFVFTHKIYGSNDSIINRVSKQWQHAKGNLGVLLNGTRGAGKTVTSKLLANHFVDNGIPTILVNHPVPLGTILEHVSQPCVVIFDEFEKTHDEDAQKALLSVIDGLNKNEQPRLFLFTTNSMDVNINFRERPGRIRYIFSFNTIPMDVLEEIVDDKLHTDVAEYRNSLLDYLVSRSILTIDTVTSAIDEVNIHGNGPDDFKDFFNSEQGTPPAWRIVHLVNEDGNVIEKDICPNFGIDSSQFRRALLNRSGMKKFMELYPNGVIVNSNGRGGAVSGYSLKVYEYHADDDTFTVALRVPAFKTLLSKIPTEFHKYFPSDVWIDDKPENFQILPPEGAKKKAIRKFYMQWADQSYGMGSVHGTASYSYFRVKILENREEPGQKTYSYVGDIL